MENRDFVDQKLAARVLARVAADQDLLAKQGSVVEGWREYRGRRLGPYFRLTYRLDGRQRSIYLGADPALADTVRRRLADLQTPRRRRQALSRLRTRAKKSLSKHKTGLRAELAKVGLYLKGNEVRGMRSLTRRLRTVAAQSVPPRTGQS